MKKQIIVIVFGLMFLFFSLLQINDPDGYLWMVIYLIPALLSLSLLFNYHNTYTIYFSPFYLIIASYIYLNNNDTTTMNIFSEHTNESLGLVLCGIWIYILPKFKIE